MKARLLVKNIANAFSTGDVIGVFDGAHVFGRLESKTRFIESGNDASEWPRQFAVVNVTDAERSDYLYLMEDLTHEEDVVVDDYIYPEGYEDLDDSEYSLLDEEERAEYDKAQAELEYSISTVESAEKMTVSRGRRYYIQPQGPDSPFYDELIEHAEVTVNKSIFDSLIIDRGA